MGWQFKKQLNSVEWYCCSLLLSFFSQQFDDFVFTYVWTLFPFSAKRKGRCLTWRQIVDNLAITPSLTPVSDVNGGTIAISPKFGQPFQVTKNTSGKSQSETERVEWMKIIGLFERFFFYNLETFKKCFYQELLNNFITSRSNSWSVSHP